MADFALSRLHRCADNCTPDLTTYHFWEVKKVVMSIQILTLYKIELHWDKNPLICLLLLLLYHSCLKLPREGLKKIGKFPLSVWPSPLSGKKIKNEKWSTRHETNSVWYGSSDTCQMASLQRFKGLTHLSDQYQSYLNTLITLSCIHLLTNSPTQLLTYPPTQLARMLTYSPTNLLTYLLTNFYAYSLTNLLCSLFPLLPY